MHGGLTDPRELGRKGGRGRTRSVLGISDQVADDALRTKARKRLEKQLDDPNPQIAGQAARALYSYRATEAPRDPDVAQQHEGRGVFGIAQLCELAAELQVFSQLGGMDALAEQDLLDNLRAGQARALVGAGDISATDTPPSSKNAGSKDSGNPFPRATSDENEAA
jgi:hypothetical protein